MTEEEFARVVVENRTHLVQFAMWRGRLKHEAAEDVVQDVLVELLEKYPSFELRARGVKTWLWTSLMYRIVDRYRSEERETAAREKFHEALPPLMNSSTMTEYEVDLARLLPAEILDIVRAVFFEGHGYEHVAAELGEHPRPTRGAGAGGCGGAPGRARSGRRTYPACHIWPLPSG